MKSRQRTHKHICFRAVKRRRERARERSRASSAAWAIHDAATHLEPRAEFGGARARLGHPVNVQLDRLRVNRSIRLLCPKKETNLKMRTSLLRVLDVRCLEIWI
eukprot:6074284-Pleurochrysis_carterae.AAC.1